MVYFGAHLRYSDALILKWYPPPPVLPTSHRIWTNPTIGPWDKWGDPPPWLRHCSKSRHVKVLLMTAIIPFVFLETICICSEKFSSLSIIIPKSLSRCDLDLYTDMLPIVLSHGIIRYIRRMSQCQCVITLHLSKLNNSFHLVDHVTKISISDCNC